MSGLGWGITAETERRRDSIPAYWQVELLKLLWKFKAPFELSNSIALPAVLKYFILALQGGDLQKSRFSINHPTVGGTETADPESSSGRLIVTT